MKIFALLTLLFGIASTLMGQLATLTSGADGLEPTPDYLQYEWRIRNQIMGWRGTLQIPLTQGAWDTLYFRENPQQEWFPMLCQIRTPGTYTFMYNSCCGGFSVKNDREKYFTTVRAKFVIEGKKRAGSYVGIYGGAAYMLVSDHAVLAETHCLSVMQSNVMGIGIGEWENAGQGDEADWICLFDSEGNDYGGDENHTFYSALHKTHIAPFESGTVLIHYNPRRNTIRYEWLP